jgi:ribosome hibernation promoting factor
MQVTIIGRHMDVPQDVKTYIDEKARKLPHYYDQVMAVQAVVETLGPKYQVELLISVAGHEDFVSKEKGNDIFACFDVCRDHAEKQLRRFKEKIRGNKHHTSTGELFADKLAQVSNTAETEEV